MIEQTQLPFVPAEIASPKSFDSRGESYRRSGGPSWRSIHYLGSKLRIKDWIVDAVDEADPSQGQACDLFAGSGIVSKALSERRDVIAVDIQEYSRVLCSALLESRAMPSTPERICGAEVRENEHTRTLLWAFEPIREYESECLEIAASGEAEPLCDFLEHASLVQAERFGLAGSGALREAVMATHARLEKARLANSAKTVVTRYYGGVYFSFLQAAAIDALLEAISSHMGEPEHDRLLASVLGAASDAVNTVGKQFAQPIRPRTAEGTIKPNLAKRVARDRHKDVFALFDEWSNSYSVGAAETKCHEVWKLDYREALARLPSTVSVIYADPPYTRDHYSRYYHVLETICLRDCPEISTLRTSSGERVSRGVYREGRHQSPFCIKSQAPAAFRQLFQAVSALGLPLVLSYSPFESGSEDRPRLMTMAQIHQLASEAFGRIEVWSARNFSHNKLNRSDLNKRINYGAEQLLICRP